MMNSTEKDVCLFLEVMHVDKSNTAVQITAILTSVINAGSAVLAILGNSIVLFVIIKTEHLQTPSNVLLASLSITDLLVGLIVQPLSIVRRVYEAKNQQQCLVRIIYSYFGFLCAAASFLNIGLISIDRCLAICKPFKYEELASNRAHIMVVATVWLVWALFSLLPFVGALSARAFFVVLFSVLGVNMCIVIVCYALIFRIILQQRRQIASIESFGIIEGQPAAATPSLPEMDKPRSSRDTSDSDTKGKVENGNAQAIMIVIVAMFICYVPQMTVMLLRGVIGDNANLILIADAWVDTITFINSSINPAIYCLRMTPIKLAVFHRLGITRN